MEIMTVRFYSRKFFACLVAVMVGVMAVVLTTGTAKAHFNLETNVRIIHVEHAEDGLHVYIRLPTPYLLSTSDDASGDGAQADPKRFVIDEPQDGQTLHRLNVPLLQSQADAFAALVADGHELRVDGKLLVPETTVTRIYRSDDAPAFSTLAEAKEAFGLAFEMTNLGEPYVGDTQTDTLLVYRLEDTPLTYAFSSNLNPGLSGQDATVNLLADHLPGATRLYQATGILSDPIEVSRSAFASLLSFVYQGVIHIIEGIDHVLFVVCLALGAATITGLLWRVTGFTLGHTVTLTLGFFGFVPSGAWFVPTVETGIALSIIYAAAAVLFGRSDRTIAEWRWFVITGLIGLLHGLGFSFVLHEILQVNSPNVWQSLLAFNVGVELGQLLIVLAVWPLSLFLAARYAQIWKYLRGLVLVGCILISLVWTFERVSSVIQSI